MAIGLLAALGAAVCYGVGSVLQAVGARRTTAAVGIDPRLLVRLLGQSTFVIGSMLDVVGFVLALVALRSLPLYVVQATIASNLAVSAVLAARVMHARLANVEWTGVAAATFGLALLGLSAGEQGPVQAGHVFRWGLVVASVAVVGLGIAAGGVSGARGAAALGFVSGLGFGIVSLAGRVLIDLTPAHLWRDGAMWALVLAGAVGFLLHAVALQRGSVATATVGVVLGETILPVTIGIVVLGDTTRSGFVPVAAVGFLLAVAGALTLSRFGELEPEVVGGRRASQRSRSPRARKG
ncbi:MAG: hypothetical protein M3Z46_09775 [Actinomycetota bacterium]|nr:hypothetical protein [Actinomycetota bacterium]